MSEIHLEVRESIESKPERVNAKGRMPAEPKHYDTPKVELSKGIKSFDKRPRTDPFAYNTISLKKKSEIPTPTMSSMLADPTYNLVGRFLGVDTHSWNRDYTKVHDIVTWAKEKSGEKTTEGLVNWLSGAIQVVPSLGMNHRKIDQLYLYSKLQQK